MADNGEVLANNNHLKRGFFWVILLLLHSYLPCYGQAKPRLYLFAKENNGIVLHGKDEKLQIDFIDAETVNVKYVPSGDFKDNGTDVCVPRQKKTVDFTLRRYAGLITLSTSRLKLEISTVSGSIKYFDSAGKLLLAENAQNPRLAQKIKLNTSVFDDRNSRTEKTANGDVVVADIKKEDAAGTAWRVRQQFTWQPGEALYGLGSHQEGYMNLRGTCQYLYEYNLKKSMPVLMSSKGYGLLFDAGSAMVFHDDIAGSFMDMLAVNQVDYYFMLGPGFDQVIHHFRSLTGKVELPPKYAFGYVQSKERYVGSHDIDSVLNRFRSARIPLDVIVQDWLYWKDGLWGYKKFDEAKYPQPEKAIANVHNNHAHFMLSIWPQLAADEEKAMTEKGFVLGRNIYDAFNPAARKMYWDNYVYKNLFIKGVDAWWCDSSEPVEFDWNRGGNAIAGDPAARFEKNVQVMSELLGAMRVNTYSLHHTQGIYENQRKSDHEKRVFILTRASYPGQQRYGTMVWNGDTKATWADFSSWIPGGLNYMVTGSPYWTIDAGAFFVRSRPEWFAKGEFPGGLADTGYREFYVRNLQYSGWLPLFRSHGSDVAREPWAFGVPGDVFYDAILKQINLRYRLLPYIYSTAAKVTNEDYTMTRSLLFDFRTDTNVYNLKDEFMFGQSFLICPVIVPMYYSPGNKRLDKVAKERVVYLPKGAGWVDFWTGKRSAGGETIDAAAPIDHIPVFVREGSIVPMGPLVQYTAEKPAGAWEIRVYPGADGKFTVYEDEGDNYNYEKGHKTAFDLSWNDKNQTLIIGKKTGAFKGMAATRELHIVMVKEGTGTGIAGFEGKKITYSGQPLTVKL